MLFTRVKSKRKVELILGNKKKQMLAAALAAAILVTAQPVVFAEEETAVETEQVQTAENSGEEEEISTITNIMSTGNRDNTYSAYYTKYSGEKAPNKEIVIEAKNAEVSEDAEGGYPEYSVEEVYEGENGCFVWTNNQGQLNFSFEVEETGIYNMEMLYYTISGKSTTVDIGIKIDGDYPFTACKDITLDRYWVDATAIRKDSRDNDLKPTQVEKDMWVTYPIKDKEGLFNDPYIFYLEKGSHTLTLEGIRTNIALKTITFKNYEELPDYEKPSNIETPALTNENSIGTKTILIQAESPLYKNSSTLYATYDRTSSKTSPSHPTKQRYNTIGSATWKKSTQAITWNFTVPNDGYYRFAFKTEHNARILFQPPYLYRRSCSE